MWDQMQGVTAFASQGLWMNMTLLEVHRSNLLHAFEVTRWPGMTEANPPNACMPLFALVCKTLT